MRKKLNLIECYKNLSEDENIFNNEEFIKEFNKTYYFTEEFFSCLHSLKFLVNRTKNTSYINSKQIQYDVINSIILVIKNYPLKNFKKFSEILDCYKNLMLNIKPFENSLKIIDIVENVFCSNNFVKEELFKYDLTTIKSLLLLNDSDFIGKIGKYWNMNDKLKKSHGNLVSYINGNIFNAKYCLEVFNLMESIYYEKSFKNTKLKKSVSI